MVNPLKQEFDETTIGDLLVIERVVVDAAHRGHGLALFMIEAADSVINGNMSACIVKPFPLQFEDGLAPGRRRLALQSRPHNRSTRRLKMPPRKQPSGPPRSPRQWRSSGRSTGGSGFAGTKKLST